MSISDTQSSRSLTRLWVIMIAALALALTTLAGWAPAQAAPGDTWTARMAAEQNTWNSVAYGNGLFVAVANDGANRVMTSPDGVTWTARTAANANDWKAVTYGDGLFVALSESGNDQVMTTPDGITWTSRATPGNALLWESVSYGNGTFVAVAVGGFPADPKVISSPDGITWTTRTPAIDESFESVTYGGGQFVAVAASGGTNSVMTSPDGITWTGRTAAQANVWFAVTYGDGQFVAVAFNGTDRVMTSPDGITWTLQNAAEQNAWRDITYVNGLFVAVAINGTNRIMTSGTLWTVPGAPTNVSAKSGDKKAKVSWTAPANTGGTPITGYTVTAVGTTDTCTTTGATSCEITGLKNGKSYTFSVTATNAEGTGPAATSTVATLTKVSVNALGKSKKLTPFDRTRVVKAKTNSKFKKVKTRCYLQGQKLTGKDKAAACTFKKEKANTKAKVWVTPNCSVGLTVEVKIVANASNASKVTWKRDWKVKNQPRVLCPISGNG